MCLTKLPFKEGGETDFTRKTKPERVHHHWTYKEFFKLKWKDAKQEHKSIKFAGKGKCMDKYIIL